MEGIKTEEEFRTLREAMERKNADAETFRAACERNNISPREFEQFAGEFAALKKQLAHLSPQKIVIFCVGASPYDEQALAAIKEHNMDGPLKDLPLFYCRGGWDMPAMSFIDRNLCKMLKKATAKKDPSSYEPWERALMEAGEGKCDWSDQAYLKPILDEIDR